MSEDISYGWTGKILRINLTTGAITTLATDPYKKYIGGMGLANKIMFDEVPAGTEPFDPENKIVFAVGPLTASGVPLAGRTTVCSLSPFTKYHQIVDAHCGGMLGARIKQAGWDGIILEGKADRHVYINIKDDKVEIKDADFVWGLGTRATTETLSAVEGTRACVATIGPAGENLLPYSCIMNSRNHCGGAGTGAVMGSKNVKALVVEGTGSVNVADPQAVADLSDYMLREIIGSNNNHAVPSTQQEWAEHYDKSSRWTSRKGLYWATAEGGAIETGEPKPGELNTVGYRCMKSTKDMGDTVEKYTIKMNGCHSCPIHCHADLKIEGLAEEGSFTTAGNTCLPNLPFKNINTFLKIDLSDDETVVWNMVLGNLIDDLGFWCNYGQIYRDLGYTISKGILKEHLPEAEYNSYHWEKFEQKDPSILVELFTAMAKNDCDLALLAHGPVVWCEKWDQEKWFDTKSSKIISYLGFPTHHFVDDSGMGGLGYNTLFNRDCMVHSASNFTRNGLPLELQQEIGREVWDGDAIDNRKALTPPNEAKARFAWWSAITDVLHDSLTLCNWVWPMTSSPVKARNYRGDLDLEAKFFKAVTGEDMTTDELYLTGTRIMTLQRAMTVRGMGNNNMREDHDKITEWPYTMDADKQPYDQGTTKLDRDDVKKFFTMVYQQYGWDDELGCPTASGLDYLDMSDVKEELAKANLLV